MLHSIILYIPSQTGEMEMDNLPKITGHMRQLLILQIFPLFSGLLTPISRYFDPQSALQSHNATQNSV